MHKLWKPALVAVGVAACSQAPETVDYDDPFLAAQGTTKQADYLINNQALLLLFTALVSGNGTGTGSGTGTR